jgi:hypothetical protein
MTAPRSANCAFAGQLVPAHQQAWLAGHEPAQMDVHTHAAKPVVKVAQRLGPSAARKGALRATQNRDGACSRGERLQRRLHALVATEPALQALITRSRQSAPRPQRRTQALRGGASVRLEEPLQAKLEVRLRPRIALPHVIVRLASGRSHESRVP